MGSRVFTRAQFATEATRGTAVAATRIIALSEDDHGPIPNDRVWEPRQYSNARRSMQNTHVYGNVLVESELSIANGYFNILPAIYISLLDGTITPVEVTPAQSDYRWDVNPSFTALNDPDTWTLELGDDTDAYEFEYLMFKSIKLSAPMPDGVSSAPVAINAPWFARQNTKTTFTASQAVHPSLTYLNAKLQRLYLDTTWAGLGTTEQTSVLRGSEVEIETGNEHKFMGDANRYFTTHGEGKIGAQVMLDLEGNATADAIRDLMQAGTQRALRLDYNGPQIGTGANHIHRLDMFGRFTDARPISARVQGNNITRAVFTSEPDSSGNELEIDVITTNSTV